MGIGWLTLFGPATKLGIPSLIEISRREEKRLLIGDQRLRRFTLDLVSDPQVFPNLSVVWVLLENLSKLPFPLPKSSGVVAVSEAVLSILPGIDIQPTWLLGMGQVANQP